MIMLASDISFLALLSILDINPDCCWSQKVWWHFWQKEMTNLHGLATGQPGYLHSAYQKFLLPFQWLCCFSLSVPNSHWIDVGFYSVLQFSSEWHFRLVGLFSAGKMLWVLGAREGAAVWFPGMLSSCSMPCCGRILCQSPISPY